MDPKKTRDCALLFESQLLRVVPAWPRFSITLTALFASTLHDQVFVGLYLLCTLVLRFFDHSI
jgi:hypothetical protein